MTRFSILQCLSSSTYLAVRGARTQGKHLHPGYSLRQDCNHLAFAVDYADLPYYAQAMLAGASQVENLKPSALALTKSPTLNRGCSEFHSLYQCIRIHVLDKGPRSMIPSCSHEEGNNREGKVPAHSAQFPRLNCPDISEKTPPLIL
jgi:hypothetical protein